MKITSETIEYETEMGGITLNIKIDRKKSGFDEYLQDSVMNWLKQEAEEKNLIVPDEEEVIKATFPIIIKVLLGDGISKKGFKGSFTDTHVQDRIYEEIMEIVDDVLVEDDSN